MTETFSDILKQKVFASRCIEDEMQYAIDDAGESCERAIKTHLKRLGGSINFQSDDYSHLGITRYELLCLGSKDEVLISPEYYGYKPLIASLPIDIKDVRDLIEVLRALEKIK